MLKIYVHPHPQSTTAPLYGFVANISRLCALSTYTFAFTARTRRPQKLKDTSKNAPKPPQSTHHLSNYPRWSEHPTALVARAIAKLPSSSLTPVAHTLPLHSTEKPSPGLEIYLYIGRHHSATPMPSDRLLTHLSVYATSDPARFHVIDQSPASPQPPSFFVVPNEQPFDPWTLTQLCFTQYAYPSSKPSKLPRNPPNPRSFVPILENPQLSTYPYINVDELPPHVKPAFLQFLAHQTAPLIPTINAAYAHTWLQFLGHEHRGSAPRDPALLSTKN